jgi:hypothetical protein
LIAALEVQQRGGPGANGVVLDECPWTEVSQPQAGERAMEVINTRPARDDDVHGFRDVGAGLVELGEPRLRPGHIAVEHQPPFRTVVVRELDTIALARRPGLAGADIGVIDQLGTQTQCP